MMNTRIIKCKKCRRPFASTADRCPDCGARSARGIRVVVIQFSSIIVAVAALATALTLAIDHFLHRQPPASTHGATPPPIPPQGSSDGEIRFDFSPR